MKLITVDSIFYLFIHRSTIGDGRNDNRAPFVDKINIPSQRWCDWPRRASVDEKAATTPHAPTPQEDPQVQPEFLLPSMPLSTTVAQTWAQHVRFYKSPSDFTRRSITITKRCPRCLQFHSGTCGTSQGMYFCCRLIRHFKGNCLTLSNTGLVV